MSEVAPTDEDLIGRYIMLRNKVSVMNEAHEKTVKPYTEAMEVVANVIHARLNERGSDSTKTPAGTAYKSTTDRFSLKDRDALVAYVQESGNLSMFTNAVSKEAVEEYMAEHDGQLPPGVEKNSFTKVNVRKS